MVQLSGFRKVYASKVIVEANGFSIGAGVYWVKGINGAGKSTLFKCLAGLIPFEGDIVVDAVSQKKQPLAYRKLVTYSEAEPVFPGFLTAKALMRFVGEIRGVDVSAQDELCDQLNISAYRDTPCATYSSGMLKKTSLATAFLGSAKVIILDEPLVTLDEASRQSLDKLIRERRRLDPGLTILVSSHEPLTHGFSDLQGIIQVRDSGIHWA